MGSCPLTGSRTRSLRCCDLEADAMAADLKKTLDGFGFGWSMDQGTSFKHISVSGTSQGLEISNFLLDVEIFQFSGWVRIPCIFEALGMRIVSPTVPNVSQAVNPNKHS